MWRIVRADERTGSNQPPLTGACAGVLFTCANAGPRYAMWRWVLDEFYNNDKYASIVYRPFDAGGKKVRTELRGTAGWRWAPILQTPVHSADHCPTSSLAAC